MDEDHHSQPIYRARLCIAFLFCSACFPLSFFHPPSLLLSVSLSIFHCLLQLFLFLFHLFTPLFSLQLFFCLINFRVEFTSYPMMSFNFYFQRTSLTSIKHFPNFKHDFPKCFLLNDSCRLVSRCHFCPFSERFPLFPSLILPFPLISFEITNSTLFLHLLFISLLLLFYYDLSYS